ncbi:MAG: hypothetical protein HYR85_03785 [Planctomycetes bacterium]|nr:hypothetical protein [Planctomycetota bacterium]MBI3848507.1 hypothetical protein [Planctomycetota bacterium]
MMKRVCLLVGFMLGGAAHSVAQPPPEPPSNDECTGAIEIGNGMTMGNNIGATTSSPTGSCGVMGSDVWYSYTATCTGLVRASFCAQYGGMASYDSQIAIFTGDCANLNEIACNDDFCGLQSNVVFPVVAGTTYFIAVGGFAGSQGSFTLSIFCCSNLDSDTSHVCVVGQPASALIFPLFESRSGKGTLITVTNLDTDRRDCGNGFREGDVCLLYTYFGFDPDLGFCREFNTTECLTPGDTLTVFADQHNPEQHQGWLWVEARDPESGRAIQFDHLIGSAIIVDMNTDFLFHYLPYGFRSHANDAVLDFEISGDACGRAFTDVDGDDFADFDGREYDFWPQELRLDNFFQQGGTAPQFGTDLTLASCDVDPFDGSLTHVNFGVWNNRERRFSAQLDFECFFRGPLTDISNITTNLAGDPNELVIGTRHIQTGWLELIPSDPILGVFHTRISGTNFAAGHQLEFVGEFGGLCDFNPDHHPCSLPRVD